jgi:hypothetical protein
MVLKHTKGHEISFRRTKNESLEGPLAASEHVRALLRDVTLAEQQGPDYAWGDNPALP